MSDEDSKDYPVMEVDLRLFSVYIEGTEEDELEEVEEKLNQQVQQRLDDVKGLKRHDQELAEEFAGEEPESASRYSQ